MSCEYCKQEKWRFCNSEYTSINSNVNIDGNPDWTAQVFQYMTRPPELVLTSRDTAKMLWGDDTDGIASIYPNQVLSFLWKEFGNCGGIGMSDKYIKLEDAIKIIREQRIKEYDERDEMFNLGLKTAESELGGLPTIEVSEDCISRKGVLKKIRSFQNADTTGTDKAIGAVLGAVHCAEIIINAPSVIPDRPKAKWINDYDEYYGDRYYCSNCGATAGCDYDEVVYDGQSNCQDLSNYCPNCGYEIKR